VQLSLLGIGIDVVTFRKWQLNPARSIPNFQQTAR
jgi:hypothetical protein